MPFDPTKPDPGDVLDAVLVRTQMVALKALIDTQAAQIATLQSEVASLQAQLPAAIAGTANNIPSITTLGLSISNPPQNYEVQPLADKVDELINTLRRG